MTVKEMEPVRVTASALCFVVWFFLQAACGVTGDDQRSPALAPKARTGCSVLVQGFQIVGVGSCGFEIGNGEAETVQHSRR